jgi:ABC-type transporter MlaC component
LEEEEQAEFVRLFRLLLLKIYARHIDRYVDQRIEYLDERSVNGRAVVETKLITPHRETRLEFGWLSVWATGKPIMMSSSMGYVSSTIIVDN